MATKKNSKEYPTDSGFVWMKRFDGEHENAPYLKGFVTLPPELVRGNTALESICYYDAERGNYSLNICLWKKGNGVLTGLINKSSKLFAVKDNIDGDDLDLDLDDEEEEDTIPFAFEPDASSTKTKSKRR